MGAICEGDYNYAFVTSTHYAGDFGGLAAADAICNDHAAAAGLPGTYVAWLSDSTTDAIDRLGSASGWLRTDRRPLARSIGDLIDKRGLLFPLLLDEHGEVTNALSVYTGTWPEGIASPDTCGDWHEAEGMHGGRGSSRDGGSSWTSGVRYPCETKAPLYCFGVDHSDGVPRIEVGGRYAFVTEGVFTPGPGQGLAQADALCRQEAADAGRAEADSYKALLATQTESAISRFSTAPPLWVRMDSLPLWRTAEAAKTEDFLVPPMLTLGGEVPLNAGAWIGASSLNEPGTKESTCDDWTSDIEEGKTLSFTQVRPSYGWTRPCSRDDVRLICMEDRS